MRMFSSLTNSDLIATLQSGGVAVVPTDTLYGLVARARDEQAVERIYRLRGRAPEKPCIILVASMEQITDTANWTATHRNTAKKYWPGPLSLIAPTTVEPWYLHRGTKTLAYRVPAHNELRQLLMQTGPLVAPSANPEGKLPATTLDQAQTYFGRAVDGYVDGGDTADAPPSTLVRVTANGEVEVLRPGAVHIDS